ncbi:hypothetical protein JOQ06_012215, partial [Pogonophryne albipinna]
MEPPCSLQLGPCGPSPSLGSQSSTAGFEQLEEKQLFEKFWRGTFKAVATPRAESVIVASITAHRRVTNTAEIKMLEGPASHSVQGRSSLALCSG